MRQSDSEPRWPRVKRSEWPIGTLVEYLPFWDDHARHWMRGVVVGHTPQTLRVKAVPDDGNAPVNRSLGRVRRIRVEDARR